MFWDEMRLGLKTINPWCREEAPITKLWVLRPRSDLDKSDDPWRGKVDSVDEFLVRAKSESDARRFADEMGLDENKDKRAPWLSDDYSTCSEIFAAQGGAGVVIRSV